MKTILIDPALVVLLARDKFPPSRESTTATVLPSDRDGVSASFPPGPKRPRRRHVWLPALRPPSLGTDPPTSESSLLNDQPTSCLPRGSGPEFRRLSTPMTVAPVSRDDERSGRPFCCSGLFLTSPYVFLTPLPLAYYSRSLPSCS